MLFLPRAGVLDGRAEPGAAVDLGGLGAARAQQLHGGRQLRRGRQLHAGDTRRGALPCAGVGPPRRPPRLPRTGLRLPTSVSCTAIAASYIGTFLI